MQHIEEIKEQLAKEEELTMWAVKLQREGRSGRLAALRKKELL